MKPSCKNNLSSGCLSFTAIKCKLCDKDAKFAKNSIDSFIHASDTKYFTQRYIVANNENWTNNVRNKLADKCLPIKIITHTDLEESSIDWSFYLESNKTQIQSLCYKLRPYQEAALNKVISGFKSHDRVKLIMAGGTGRTFTSLKIAEHQTVPHGFVLFLVPSLSLLAQTLSYWKFYSTYPISAFAVYSDSKVGRAKDELEDLIATSELNYPLISNPESLARAIKRIDQLIDNEELTLFHATQRAPQASQAAIHIPQRATYTPRTDTYAIQKVLHAPQTAINTTNTDRVEASNKHALGMTVVFATYHSIDVVATAQHTFGLPEFDLVICDDVHRSTDGFAHVHGDVNQPLVPLLESQNVVDKLQNIALEASEVSNTSSHAANNTVDEIVVTVIENEAQNSNAVTGEAQDKSDKSQDKSNKLHRNRAAISIVNDAASAFSFVHNNEYLHAKKRLYMTATPKINVDRQGVNGEELDVYYMDIESSSGSIFYFPSFSDAVRLGRGEESFRSAIIKKIGHRKSWEQWAEDVAEICQKQGVAIETHLKEHPESLQAFNDFKHELSSTVRVKLSDDEVIDLLSQHIVVKPVLDELFRGFPFADKNPIAHALTKVLELLDKDGLHVVNKQLKDFYNSVARRMTHVKTLAERQIVIVDLFDNFFKKAFPKQQEKLGIVYTPVEIVDFINHSVNDLLQKEFGISLSSKDVHILDPFTGTGTFITRMMLDQELIKPEDLERKFQHELHAYEIMPLAYYVASINIEAAYAELTYQSPNEYERNNIVVLTDTFADKFDEDCITVVNSELDHNNELREQIESYPLRVIVGNPPYSAGQSSQNDDNQNTLYPILDARVAETYGSKAGKVKLKSKLYDSYIRAFRWASDHLGKQGIIAFVSNAGWLDSASAKGMRRCLQEEFSSIYIYHLKGNQRTFGEQSRIEGGKIFGDGSRAPIAITILVKNPFSQERGKIYFAAVDDYLSRENKLDKLKSLGSMVNARFTEIAADEYGDWLNQRRSDFMKFIPLDGKNNDGLAVFSNFSLGIFTSRDPWSYNASRQTIAANFTKCISFYNSQVEDAKQHGDKFERNNDSTLMKWDRPQISHLKKSRIYSDFNVELIFSCLYRPFFKEWLYNDSAWINCTYQMPKLYPYQGAENLVLMVSGLSAKSPSCLMSSMICDLNILEAGAQCFPRYVYRKADEQQVSTKDCKANEESKKSQEATGSRASEDSKEATSNNAGGGEPLSKMECRTVSQKVDKYGYIREDAINPEAVEHFRLVYPEEASMIDADSVFYYIYGILHSTEYRLTYANNMQKELPRIPRMATYAEFRAFEQAGRALAKLHVDYEHVPMYKGCQIYFAPNANFLVEQLKYGKIAGKKGNASKDKTTIIYNSGITIRNIPLEAQEYVVNKKSALDWMVERCCISQDKYSKIVNNYNDYAKEIGDEKYIFNLILRVITVSLETIKIIKTLPQLNVHPFDK